MSAAEWTLTIDVCGRPMVTNRVDKLHHHAYARLRGEWRDATATLARAARIPPQETITVVCWPEYPDRRSLPDCDGVAPSLKGALDGLVVAGVIPDDRPPFVRSITYLPAVVRAGVRPGLVLRVVAGREG